MRHFWDGEFPVGDPLRGAPFGERMDPAALGMASQALTVVSAGMQYRGARDAGRQAQVAADFEGRQLERYALQAQAAAQRRAYNERRLSERVQSRALAVAAASGGGASDPTVVDIIGDLAEEGAYRGALELFEGDEQARSARDKAAATRYSGAAAERAYRSQATGALLRGGTSIATSLYSKYGGGGPNGRRSGALSNAWLDAGTEGYGNLG